MSDCACNLGKESIGVVTFNISQQTLIEDKLQEEFSNDIKFDKWANEREEKLFVKNLENVQGDERDIILFSIAFGPDEEGKLSLNFGPLNKEGGWKGLNVAVSRARSEMVVFTTMTAAMIDLKRTKSKGVESLKNFLEFAEKGKIQLSYVEMQQRKEQGILDCICLELDKAGYKYQKAVGHSKFKVDLAVINPFNPDEYILGIMLDGDSYKQSANTKDREVAQATVLGTLGWKLHRIWTMDWWDNKDKELSKLFDILAARKADYDGPIIEESSEDKPNEAVDTEDMVSNENEKEIVQAECIIESSSTSKVSEIVEKTEETVGVQMSLINNTSVKEIPKAADIIGEKSVLAAEKKPLEGGYSSMDYISADVEVTPISTSDYVVKSAIVQIVAHMQKIIDIEAPISYDRLIRRTLRSFDISRASAQTTEAYNDSRMEGLDVTIEAASEIVTDLRNKMQNSEYCKEENEAYLSVAGHYLMYKDIFELPVKETLSVYDSFKLNMDLFAYYPHPEFGGNPRQNNVVVSGAKFEPVDYHDIFIELAKVDVEIKDFFEKKEEISVSEYIKHTVRVHHRLTTIHPFPEGNGRTSRAFMNVQLVRAGLTPIYIKVEEKEKYIDALEKADVEKNYDELYEVIFKIIIRSHIELSMNP